MSLARALCGIAVSAGRVRPKQLLCIVQTHRPDHAEPNKQFEMWFPEALLNHLAAEEMIRLTPKRYRVMGLAQSAGSLNLLPLSHHTTSGHAQLSADCWLAKAFLPLTWSLAMHSRGSLVRTSSCLSACRCCKASAAAVTGVPAEGSWTQSMPSGWGTSITACPCRMKR